MSISRRVSLPDPLRCNPIQYEDTPAYLFRDMDSDTQPLLRSAALRKPRPFNIRTKDLAAAEESKTATPLLSARAEYHCFGPRFVTKDDLKHIKAIPRQNTGECIPITTAMFGTSKKKDLSISIPSNFQHVIHLGATVSTSDLILDTPKIFEAMPRRHSTPVTSPTLKFDSMQLRSPRFPLDASLGHYVRKASDVDLVTRAITASNRIEVLLNTLDVVNTTYKSKLSDSIAEANARISRIDKVLLHLSRDQRKHYPIPDRAQIEYLEARLQAIEAWAERLINAHDMLDNIIHEQNKSMSGKGKEVDKGAAEAEQIIDLTFQETIRIAEKFLAGFEKPILAEEDRRPSRKKSIASSIWSALTDS